MIIFRLTFPCLSSLDVSLDLVSRVSQTRARNRGEANAATAIVADPAAGGEGHAGQGAGEGGDNGGGDNGGGGAAAERAADEVVDRRALFAFVEQNSSLRFVSKWYFSIIVVCSLTCTNKMSIHFVSFWGVSSMNNRFIAGLLAWSIIHLVSWTK